jgi:hypothetical protein
MNQKRAEIACDLSAIPEDERDKHQESAKRVFESIDSVKELKDGFAFRLPGDTELIEEAGAWIARERLCCPFFNFELELKPDGGPFWLRLSGSSEVKDYLQETVLKQWELE